jgi:class 3 adenylate cyclase
MTFEEIVDQAIDMVQRRGQVSYRMLKRQFDLDETSLDDLKYELVEIHRIAVDQDGKMLLWTGDLDAASASAPDPKPPPISYTPQYLTEKILTSRSALEGERKQVTVLFADIKDSTELIRDLDPEEAQKLLDPAIHIMMAAVHRFEGTVNQVLGDGIMSLFGAPIAHEDHAARACYAALAMQTAMRDYTEAVRRHQGLEGAACRQCREDAIAIGHGLRGGRDRRFQVRHHDGACELRGGVAHHCLQRVAVAQVQMPVVRLAHRQALHHVAW